MVLDNNCPLLLIPLMLITMSSFWVVGIAISTYPFVYEVLKTSFLSFKTSIFKEPPSPL